MAIVTELITKFEFKGNIRPLDKFNKTLTQSIKVMSKGALAIAGLGTAFGFALNNINKDTSMWVNQAKAVGLTIQDFQALSSISSQLGLDQQVGIDLLEEMNNKIGESVGLYAQNDFKPIGAVAEAFDILGLSFDKIKDLNPSQQFDAISEAINNMQDIQQASSAADILFGGEANKFFSLMKQQGKSFAQLKNDYKELNLLTTEGADGAVAYAKASRKASSTISSGFKEIAGIVGRELVPEIEELTKAFAIWFKDNKDFIVGTAVKILQFFKSFVRAINNSKYVLGALVIAFAVTKIAALGLGGALAIAFAPITIFSVALAAIILIVDDLMVALNGGNSVIQKFIKNLTGIDIVPILKRVIEDFKAFFSLLGDIIQWYINTYKAMFSGFVKGWNAVTTFLGGGRTKTGSGLSPSVLESGKNLVNIDAFGNPLNFGSQIPTNSNPTTTTNNSNVTQNNTIAIHTTETSKTLITSLDKELRNAQTGAR